MNWIFNRAAVAWKWAARAKSPSAAVDGHVDEPEEGSFYPALLMPEIIEVRLYTAQGCAPDMPLMHPRTHRLMNHRQSSLS